MFVYTSVSMEHILWLRNMINGISPPIKLVLNARYIDDTGSTVIVNLLRTLDMFYAAAVASKLLFESTSRRPRLAATLASNQKQLWIWL